MNRKPHNQRATGNSHAGLMRRMREAISKTGGTLGQGAHPSRIVAFESVAGIKLPAEFRDFLKTANGCYAPSRLHVMGLEPVRSQRDCLDEVLVALRLGFDLPPHLLAIEDLGGGRWACLDCSSAGRGQVLEVETSDGLVRTSTNVLAANFEAYCWARLDRPPNWEALGKERLMGHIAEFQRRHEYSHKGKGKLPRNHEWRPYRFCIQDVIFASTVLRHSREENCLEVDVFLTAQIEGYDKLAGALALARFLLSEAWKCGGSMEIRFKHVEGGHVPAALRALADQYDVPLRADDRLIPDESKSLYAALAGFSEAGLARLRELEVLGRVSVALACYLVHQNLWTVPQIELLILGSELPELILRGLAPTGHRQLVSYSLARARQASLAGLFLRTIGHRGAPASGASAVELEDNLIPFQVSVDGLCDALILTADEPLHLPWSLERTAEVPAGQSIRVFVRAWSTVELGLAEWLLQQFRSDYGLSAMLLPGDFYSLQTSDRERIIDVARQKGLILLAAPESTEYLDIDSIPRIARARLLRT